MPELTQEEAEKQIANLGQEYIAAETALQEHRKLVAEKTNECYEFLSSLHNRSRNATKVVDNEGESKHIKLNVELNELKKQTAVKLEDAYTKLIAMQRAQVNYYVSLVKYMGKELSDYRAKDPSHQKMSPIDDADNVYTPATGK